MKTPRLSSFPPSRFGLSGLGLHSNMAVQDGGLPRGGPALPVYIQKKPQHNGYYTQIKVLIIIFPHC